VYAMQWISMVHEKLLRKPASQHSLVVCCCLQELHNTLLCQLSTQLFEDGQHSWGWGLDRTDSASCVQLKALPRTVRWLCWLEQAQVAMLRI
jgi:hypothetical protein